MVPRLIHNRPGPVCCENAWDRYATSQQRLRPGKRRLWVSRELRPLVSREGRPRPGCLDQNAATGILVRSIWHLGGIFAPMPVECPRGGGDRRGGHAPRHDGWRGLVHDANATSDLRKLTSCGSRCPSRSRPNQISSWSFSVLWSPTSQPARLPVRKTFW